MQSYAQNYANLCNYLNLLVGYQIWWILKDVVESEFWNKMAPFLSFCIFELQWTGQIWTWCTQSRARAGRVNDSVGQIGSNKNDPWSIEQCTVVHESGYTIRDFHSVSKMWNFSPKEHQYKLMTESHLQISPTGIAILVHPMHGYSRAILVS